MNKKEICENQHSFFERLNYYFGKMMTVRDFKDEQKYFNEKRWILNRLGLGWGVLCGLKVKPHPTQQDKVILEPGFALDKYGKEIMVCQEQVIDLTKDIEGEKYESPPESPCLYIYIQHYECPVEPNPIPVDECGEYKSECEYNRTRESFKIIVSHDKPDLSNPLDIELKDLFECQIDCFRFLKDATPVIIESCPNRVECILIPLARICVEEGSPPMLITEKDIDNSCCRKLAFSNEILYQLFHCMQHELWKVHAARYDRKQYVPLLAQTIKGLQGRNGKIIPNENVGKHPTRITTDGNCIWLTDQAWYPQNPDKNRIIRIDRETNTEKMYPEILLDEKSWGIAYDRNYMWVTHHETTAPGKISRINVCDFSKETMDQLYDLPDNPKEILFDGRYLWISHDTFEQRGSEDIHYLSQFDPEQCILIQSHEISFARGTISEGFVRSMVYDGHSIWIVYKSENVGKGLRRIDILEHGEIYIHDPFDSEGKDIRDVTFDGTHIWVIHEKGVTKFNIENGDDVWTALNQERGLSAITFDGQYIWAADPFDKKLFRVDIFSNVYNAGFEQIIEEYPDYEIARVCFDGFFIWVAASQKPGEERTGIIHRLLP